MLKKDESRVLWILCFLCPTIAAQLRQCLHSACLIQGTPNAYGLGSKTLTACEPRNNRRDIASLATISVSPEDATCNTNEMFCGLSNPLICMTCDRTLDYERHEPNYMIDDIKWTWWQTKSLPSNKFSINVTLNLPKMFLMTDDMKLEFHDGVPRQMIVEKSGDYGKTWTVLQYYADNCLKRFGKQATKMSDVLPSVEEALSDICTEDFSVNLEETRSLVPVFITQRLNALSSVQGFNEAKLCSAMSNNTGRLKKFLEITNFRIRLLHPAILKKRDSEEKEEIIQQSSHYGIKKVEIFGRCQCNGHAGKCMIGKKSAKCVCEHNTIGSECERCRPLFWNTRWMPGVYAPHDWKGRANPCVSYYSESYWEKWILKDNFNESGIEIISSVMPKLCHCNKHSNRCEHMPRYSLMCVDCRHNTEGQNCHRCSDKYFRNYDKSLDDREACQACSCSRLGSYSLSCRSNGQCLCRSGYMGKKCDTCTSNYYKSGKRCKRIKEECKEAFQKECPDVSDVREICLKTPAYWCSCLDSGKTCILPTYGTRRRQGHVTSGQDNATVRLHPECAAWIVIFVARFTLRS